MKGCKVYHCMGKHYARGFCFNHYIRVWKKCSRHPETGELVWDESLLSDDDEKLVPRYQLCDLCGQRQRIDHRCPVSSQSSSAPPVASTKGLPKLRHV